MTQEILNACVNSTNRPSFEFFNFAKIKRIEKSAFLNNREENRNFKDDREIDTDNDNQTSVIQSSDEVLLNNVDLSV